MTNQDLVTIIDYLHEKYPNSNKVNSVNKELMTCALQMEEADGTIN